MFQFTFSGKLTKLFQNIYISIFVSHEETFDETILKYTYFQLYLNEKFLRKKVNLRNYFKILIFAIWLGTEVTRGRDIIVYHEPSYKPPC